jgi:exopolysaccharide biosynthesis polyprenyl glycosylphosphotransferase
VVATSTTIASAAEALDGATAVALARPRALAAGRLLPLALLAVDTLALGVAFALGYLVRFKAGVPLLETPPHSVHFYSFIAFWAVPVWAAIFALYGLYDRRYRLGDVQTYSRIANACTAGAIALVVMSFFDETVIVSRISRGWLLLTWLLAIFLVSAGRCASGHAVRALRRRGRLVVPTIVVGANAEGQALAEQFAADPGAGARVVGFVDDAVRPGEVLAGGVPVLGGLAALREVMERHPVRQLVVATSAIDRGALLDLFRGFGQDDGVDLRLSSGLFEILTTGVEVQEISCVSLMTPKRVRITGLDAALKSILDYAIAGAALVVLLPVLALLGVLIKLDSPGPVLHRRRVLGRSGRPFDAFKLRTMVVDADAVLRDHPELRDAFQQGYKLKVDPRVTRLGRVLRRSSLDELPQLINVLRGEMSLVGPRMIAPDEAPRYGKWRLNLLTVKPGITGPWQVEGRSDIPYAERVRLSMHYVRNYSIWLDARILLRTLLVVAQGKGAY